MAPACMGRTALPQGCLHEQIGLYSSKHREKKPGGTQTEPTKRQDHRHATLGTRSGPAAPSSLRLLLPWRVPEWHLGSG